MAKILLIEDDESLCLATKQGLELQRHVVDTALSGLIGWNMIDTYDYDLFILDWDLPELSGIDILRRLRQRANMMPVLMLTGKEHIQNKEEAFEAGADDYLTKPFHPRELYARLQALLRRPPLLTNATIHLRNLRLDQTTRKVHRDNQEISLQPLEFDLLEFFMKHPNQVFPLESLLERIWGSDADVSLDAVYACIKRIRKKLDLPNEPSIFKTVYRTGYCLEA